MTLLDLIKAEQLYLRKKGEKEKAAVLTTLIGEASPKGNDIEPDTESVVRSFIKNAKLTLDSAPNDPAAKLTIELLEVYLPKALTEEEHAVIVGNLFAQYKYASIKQIGKFMQSLPEIDGLSKEICSRMFRERITG